MSFHVSLDSLEGIHSCLMDKLLGDPDCESAPRGKPIKELIATSFTLTNPRNRIVTSPARVVNYGFAVGELCWYLRGDRDLETMRYYNKRMTQFSDDGVTINSAYGHRMFRERWEHWQGMPDMTCVSVGQFDNVIQELVRDPDSRRAVMHINEPYDLKRALTEGSKDVPCTMSVQLLVRDRRLHMHVLMRSNDVVWGLPYDVFSFTCLQEAFMLTLRDAGVPVDDLGCYHHTAGSLHLYDTHYEMAGLVTKEQGLDPAPMSPFTLEELDWLANQFEPACRASVDQMGLPNIPRPCLMDENCCTRFDQPSTLDWMVSMLVDHRDRRVIERIEKEKHEHQQ